MELTTNTITSLLYSLFKYTVLPEDIPAIELAIQDRTDYVLDYCNIRRIPKRLHSQLARMICGEFLYQKLLFSGPESIGLAPEAIEAIVSSITEDDTTVSFGTSGDVSSLALIRGYFDQLRKGNRLTLQEHRRLR